MIQYFLSSTNNLMEIPDVEKGCWVMLIAPTEEEILHISESCEVDPDFIRAALDEEERARIEADNGQTVIIVDIPLVQAEGTSFIYNTIPMGIVLTEDTIITVCLKESPIFNDFTEGRIKGFDTRKKTRFILQLLHRNATRFLLYLRQIDRASTRVQSQLTQSMKNKELIQLLGLEKSLVYFSTSLASNEMVLEKLMKVDYIKKYPDDIDLLGDVIVENKQAIEMCNIYRDILSGTMDAFASVISNNLNIVMKFLAAMTIVLTIPTLIASIWGMNVQVPFASNPYGFWIILGLIAVATTLVILWLKRKKMF